MNKVNEKKIDVGAKHGWVAFIVSLIVTTCIYFVLVYVGEDKLNITDQSDDQMFLRVAAGAASSFLFLVVFIILKITFRRIHEKRILHPREEKSLLANGGGVGMKYSSKIWVAGTAFVIVVVMFLTNPKMSDFGYYIQSEMTRSVQKNNGGDLGALFGGIGVSYILNSTVRDDYMLFSIYTTPLKGPKGKTLGVFGEFIDIS